MPKPAKTPGTVWVLLGVIVLAVLVGLARGYHPKQVPVCYLTHGHDVTVSNYTKKAKKVEVVVLGKKGRVVGYAQRSWDHPVSQPFQLHSRHQGSSCEVKEITRG